MGDSKRSWDQGHVHGMLTAMSWLLPGQHSRCHTKLQLGKVHPDFGDSLAVRLKEAQCLTALPQAVEGTYSTSNKLDPGR